MITPAPFVLALGVAEVLIMAGYEGEGIPADWDIPIPEDGCWRQVVQYLGDGDEIVIAGIVDGQVALQVAAVVVALHEETRSIQVIA